MIISETKESTMNYDICVKKSLTCSPGKGGMLLNGLFSPL